MITAVYIKVLLLNCLSLWFRITISAQRREAWELGCNKCFMRQVPAQIKVVLIQIATNYFKYTYLGSPATSTKLAKGIRDLVMAEVTLAVTQLDCIPEVVESIRCGFQSRRTFPLDYRCDQLKRLKKMISENLDKLFEAMWIDLHKAPQEVLFSELNVITGDIDHALKKLHSWMAPKFVEKDLINKFNSAYIQSEPYGVVLIISPWNYPLLLSLQPLVGAISAGNACVLKPSEFAVATSNLFIELVPTYLDKDCYTVITGGVDVAVQVLKQRFDYIFFTGSANVGKSVMKSAAEHLTPLTLELGGKSPCVVADDANLELAAKRIVWGKLLNVGQSCISPDYILCSPTVQKMLSELCKAAIQRFYGEDPKQSPDYGRIINSQNYGRILSLMETVKSKIFYGGESDVEDRYIAPTILLDVTGEDAIMSKEIFGPLLPFVPVDSIQDAIDFINSREKPLALYVFTDNHEVVKAITQQTSCGGVTQNDTMMHYAVSSLPFGGVGHSGFGSYHGKHSFDCFSHCKPVLSSSVRGVIEGLNNMRYPPYTEAKMKDLQQIQTEGGVSRLIRLANLLTRSASGVAAYRHERADRQKTCGFELDDSQSQSNEEVVELVDPKSLKTEKVVEKAEHTVAEQQESESH